MAGVRFLPAAEDDYEEALAWYQARSALAAAGFQASVDDGVQRVADQPASYPSIDKRHRYLTPN